MEKDCEECLGELFSAQKEKMEAYEEELKELDRIHKEQIALFQEEMNKIDGFIHKLLILSPFWGSTYRKHIIKFLKDLPEK